ncbi:FadR/GntR family transcriptional regulator [Kitasatospora sp. NPDC088391]|uniref:FadR/GntR family transcriptional regulator n=1 Tax=Kitasatospora sp. NPDC088391 TaxID=3364074 RepID=UPI003814FD31
MADSSRGRSGASARPLRRHEVAERIKRYIIDNRLRPGDPLPSEGELCEALAASRSSVREAVKTLDALDIVEVRHGHGTFVGRLSMSALVEGLTFRGLLSPEDDFKVLEELVDVREVLERGMAQRILDTLHADHLTELDALVDEMEAGLAAGREVITIDRRFHALLVEPLKNDLISQFSSACWDVYGIVAPHLQVITKQDEIDTVNAHRAVVAAVRGSDAAAFDRAVEAHYRPARRRIAAARERNAKAAAVAGAGSAPGAGPAPAARL